jgi:hypothetical protein
VVAALSCAEDGFIASTRHSTKETIMNLQLRLVGVATTMALFALPVGDALKTTAGRSWCCQSS